MPMFNNYDIVEMPLTVKRNRTMVENFLAKSDLRLDDVDYYAAVVDRDTYDILAGGGFEGDIIKCIAVSDSLRGTGVSQQLISHLISQMNARGHNSVKVFTKPGNIDIFESLGFETLGKSSKAILLENGLDGLSTYVNYLNSLKREGNNGMIVMNANPFTLGHQYLVEQAAIGNGNCRMCPSKECHCVPREQLHHLGSNFPFLFHQAGKRRCNGANRARPRHHGQPHRSCAGSDGALCRQRAHR